MSSQPACAKGSRWSSFPSSVTDRASGRARCDRCMARTPPSRNCCAPSSRSTTSRVRAVNVRFRTRSCSVAPSMDFMCWNKPSVSNPRRRVAIRCNVRGERARWVAMAVDNAELALRQRIASRADLRSQFDALQELLGLEDPPERIECFDVSHTGGESMVASCVVFGHDGAKKSDYRRFNITGVKAGDDYGAMRSAIERRYARLRREDAVLPDLLLIDGGRGTAQAGGRRARRAADIRNRHRRNRKGNHPKARARADPCSRLRRADHAASRFPRIAPDPEDPR